MNLTFYVFKILRKFLYQFQFKRWLGLPGRDFEWSLDMSWFWLTLHFEVESLIESGCCLVNRWNFEVLMKSDVCGELWGFGDHGEAGYMIMMIWKGVEYVGTM